MKRRPIKDFSDLACRRCHHRGTIDVLFNKLNDERQMKMRIIAGQQALEGIHLKRVDVPFSMFQSLGQRK